MATMPYLALPRGARSKDGARYGAGTIFMSFPRPGKYPVSSINKAKV